MLHARGSKSRGDSLWNVLVVDDEVQVLKALRRALEDDFNVFAEQNIDDALERLRGREIDVVISDYRLEGSRTGIDLFEELKSRGIHTINILLTGKADVQMGVDAVNRASIYRIVLKPWDDDKLIDMIKTVLEKREAIRRRPISLDELKSE